MLRQSTHKMGADTVVTTIMNNCMVRCDLHVIEHSAHKMAAVGKRLLAHIHTIPT